MFSLIATLAVIGTLFAPAEAQSCTPIVSVIGAQANHQIFARTLRAIGLQFIEGQPYTVFAPTDAAFSRLLEGYGIDPSSEQSIRSSPLLPRLAGFIRYYVVPGTYTVSDLAAREANSELRTLFDPAVDGETCSDPNAASSKPSDGDLRVVVAGNGAVSLEDDGVQTPDAPLTLTNLEACDGIVHLMDGILNPCCPDSPTATNECVSATFDDRQRDHPDVVGNRTPGVDSGSTPLACAAPLAAALLAAVVAVLG